MAKRVSEVLNIDEAFCTGKCPYCGKDTKDKIDKHLVRCPGRKKAMEAAARLTAESARWALHGECGRVMILSITGGLVLVENNSRRYVVPAADLTVGCVSVILEKIIQQNLSEDQILELVSHLLSMTKNVDMRVQPIQPAIRKGNKVEFIHQGKLVVGEVQSRHGPHCYIVRTGNITVNLPQKDVISMVE